MQKKLNIKTVYKWCHDKAFALSEFEIENNLDLSEDCYMGDDINDLPAIKIADFSIAPNAHSTVLKKWILLLNIWVVLELCASC